MLCLNPDLEIFAISFHSGKKHKFDRDLLRSVNAIKFCISGCIGYGDTPIERDTERVGRCIFINKEQFHRYLKDEPIIQESLPAGNTALESEANKQVKPEKLGTRERETLLKMIIGMAIRGYSYNPLDKKNDAVKDIQEDLSTYGIELSDDTIRNKLKEASDLIPKTAYKP